METWFRAGLIALISIALLSFSLGAPPLAGGGGVPGKGTASLASSVRRLPGPGGSKIFMTQVPNGVLTSGPALTSWSQTRADLFGRGLDGALWHAFRTSTGWSDWQYLGGRITDQTGPAAVAWGPNRIDVFVEGVDRQLWHLWWDGASWSSWQPLGGILTDGPAVASQAAGRLDVVVAGSDSAIYHMWWAGSSWSGWERLGGTTYSAPAIAAWGPGKLDVFVAGTDPRLFTQQLWHAWWDGSRWAGWEPLGGSMLTSPAAASSATGELDVVAPGADGTLGDTRYVNGSWLPWTPNITVQRTSYPPALAESLDGTREQVCLTDLAGTAWCGVYEGS